MAVASNPLLLQLGAAARTASVSATGAAKPNAADAEHSTRFADLYARQNHDVATTAKADPGPAAARDTAGPAAQKGTAAQSAVADSGKKLPVSNSDKAEKPEETDKTSAEDDDKVSDVAENGETAVSATTTPVDPGTTPVPADPSTNVMVSQPLPPAQLVAAIASEDTEAPIEGFDPTQDVLADLPALRLALEQSAKNNGTTSAHASQPSPSDPSAGKELGAEGNFVNGLAAMLGSEQAGEAGEGSDSSFAGLIDDGLKDLDGASSDTRVDDFADRLQGLTQAVTARTANAVPVAGPLGQPLAMQQSGWTEGLVNRVMYLSSQNLKSADIQLTPAELGRLDIRVDMTPDQQTQVTFSSAHIGVREALESQQHRLKDMFNQQGMGQLDVNVSDQSRQSQSEQQAQQGRRAAADDNRGGAADSVEPAVAAAQSVASSVLLGTSAVDYYA
jgi:flagellar hook-length control protein FliK